FKRNKNRSAEQDLLQPTMYELEAALCDFYHFIAPEHSPTSHAIYKIVEDQIIYVGIAVKKIPGFKTLKEDPLTDDDLEVKFTKDYVSIETEEGKKIELTVSEVKYTKDNIIIETEEGKKIELTAKEHVQLLNYPY